MLWLHLLQVADSAPNKFNVQIVIATGILNLFGIFLAWFLNRNKLVAQDKVLHEIHILANGNLAQATAKVDLLVAQLVEAGHTPTVSNATTLPPA